MTEAGFVRVSCTPGDAVALLHRLTQLASRSFRPLDRSLAGLPHRILSRLHGYRHLTAVEFPAPASCDGVASEAQIDDRADELRDAWDLGMDPIPSLCERL